MLDNQVAAAPDAGASPLTAACDLWVLPTPRHSRWFTQIDWYLNWQMCKGLAYGGLHLPTETYRVAAEFDVPLSEAKPGEAPALLVASSRRVPADKCLVLDADKPLAEWLADTQARLEKLQAKRVRVFLPTGTKRADAERAWGRLSSWPVEFSEDLGGTP